MKFNADQTFDLLKYDFYIKRLELANFTVWISKLKDASYNFIIPRSNDSAQPDPELDKALKSYTDNGYQFSYYIEEADIRLTSKLTKNRELLYTDRYIFFETTHTYQLEEKALIYLNKENVDQFIEIGEICFPEWDTVPFTEWCLNSPNVEVVGIVEDGKIIAFAGYFARSDFDLILLMNSGTHPDHRRQGLHHYLVKLRINKNLSNGGHKTFYSNVEDGGASHQSLEKLGFQKGPLYYVYKT